MKTIKRLPYVYAQIGESFGRWPVWAATDESLEDEKVVGYYRTESEAIHAKFEILAGRRVPKSTASSIVKAPRHFLVSELCE